ncbi:MAG: glycosyltransferase [Carboxylicivirga sp.]|jgi:hypothetical protein|nr:glycosyltransferase [Carboxylicivirga sp.]
MKIILYDPLFSEFGHFHRYSEFICKLLSDIDYVNEVIVIAESDKLLNLSDINSQKIVVKKVESSVPNLQTRILQSSNIKKIWLYIKAYKNYTKIIRHINGYKADYVFLLNQGQLPFWLAIRKIKLESLITAISIKWLYIDNIKDRVNNFFFTRALKFARRIFFTEDIYYRKANSCGISTGFVFPDRSLDDERNEVISAEGSVVNLVTLGTIAKGKSPDDFLQEFINLDKDLLSNFKYTIAGKDIDGTMHHVLANIDEVREVSIIDDYLSEEVFSNLIDRADFVVIPYSESYTRYATSGIMWDCFQKNKPILCPDIELFSHYISKYRIGYTYKKGKLDDTLLQIIRERKQFSETLHQNYHKLIRNYSQSSLANKIRDLLIEMHNENR